MVQSHPLPVPTPSPTPSPPWGRPATPTTITVTWSPAATIIPDPANPQAFNRYSYCLNNPLRYNDPSGHWEWPWEWDWGNIGKNALNGLQGALDLLGFIPALGEGADLLNAFIYTLSGDEINAGISIAACLPFAGWAATATRVGKRFTKLIGDVADTATTALKHTDDIAKSVVKTLRNGGYTSVTLQPGDTIYRVYEVGNTTPRGSYATDYNTISQITSTQSAIDELALPSARPNRVVELEVTRSITVQYGLIADGGESAYQYYIDDKYFDALDIVATRVLK